MKRIYLLMAVITALLALPAQLNAQCSNGRYHDFVFPGSPTVTSNVPYGSNVNYLGTTESLLLDVYEPACDNTTSRALIIYAHGGSFVTGDKSDVSSVANLLTQLGYVVVSINYRLGFPQNPQDPQALYGFNSAIMRGLHDGRAAVRFMRNNALNGGNTYGIDPNNIYFAGVSAGGIIALHLAYQNLSGEMNMNCNNQPGTDQTSIEGNSNNLNVSSAVKGIISISGGIRDMAWIGTNDIPVCLAHGNQDGTVPYGSGYFVPQFNLFPVHGSSSIATRCNTTTTKYCFKTMYGQDHIPSNPAYADTIAIIMRNFLEHLTCGVTLNCNYTTYPSVLSPSVSIAVTAGSNQICAGESVTFTATPSNLSSPTYQWKVDGVNAGTGSTFTSTALTNGDVVTCVATPSCGSAATSSGITMTVTAAPTISLNGNTLTSSASSGNQWYRNGTLINGAINVTYTATQSGSYTVIVGGCESQAQNVVITGIGNFSNDSHFFIVYPNPNSGSFNISFNAVATESYELELKSIVGATVYQETVAHQSGQYSKQVDVAAFGKGIYLVRLSSADMDVVRKIVVY